MREPRGRIRNEGHREEDASRAVGRRAAQQPDGGEPRVDDRPCGLVELPRTISRRRAATRRAQAARARAPTPRHRGRPDRDLVRIREAGPEPAECNRERRGDPSCTPPATVAPASPTVSSPPTVRATPSSVTLADQPPSRRPPAAAPCRQGDLARGKVRVSVAGPAVTCTTSGVPPEPPSEAAQCRDQGLTIGRVPEDRRQVGRRIVQQVIDRVGHAAARGRQHVNARSTSASAAAGPAVRPARASAMPDSRIRTSGSAGRRGVDADRRRRAPAGCTIQRSRSRPNVRGSCRVIVAAALPVAPIGSVDVDQTRRSSLSGMHSGRAARIRAADEPAVESPEPSATTDHAPQTGARPRRRS